jgi:hypothetical protein
MRYPPTVERSKSRRPEFLTRLAKSALGNGANKAAALVQLAKEGVKRTLECDTAAQLQQETDNYRKGQTAFAGEVAGPRSMRVAKGVRAEEKGEFRQ